MQYPNSTRWTNYYFEKNVQGDVIGVYQKEGDGNSATHILAARYSYDPYGNPTSMTNGAGTAVSQTSNTIAAINPFRYRGYRYDGDTGLYYLQSRYYDPVSCRFVNADGYASTGQGIAGYNMFAYCCNNPINTIDASGCAGKRDASDLAAGISEIEGDLFIASDDGKYIIHVESGKVWKLDNISYLFNFASKDDVREDAIQKYGIDRLGWFLMPNYIPRDDITSYSYYGSEGVLVYEIVAPNFEDWMFSADDFPTKGADLEPPPSPKQYVVNSRHGKGRQDAFY